MGLRYIEIAGDEQAVRSHTGLSEGEFLALSGGFGKEWDHYIRHYTWCGKQRQRQSKERKNNVLSSIEDKLLFVLFFLKTNPLQQVLATTFGLNQPQASKWLELLRGHLLATLAKEKVLPERKAERLYRVVAAENVLMIDATERPVARSIDHETQKEQFSGKKKS
jgi:hypothetical protein